jgi:hypothetical protein
VAILESLRYSLKTSAIERESGIVKEIAKKEVRSVPTMKGNIPNSPACGFHVFRSKTLRPTFFIAGKEK